MLEDNILDTFIDSTYVLLDKCLVSMLKRRFRPIKALIIDLLVFSIFPSNDILTGLPLLKEESCILILYPSFSVYSSAPY